MTTSAGSGSGQSQSQSQSFIPDYEPQLSFLREFGNHARGLEDAQWRWAQQQDLINSGLTQHLVNHGYEPAGFNELNQAAYERDLYDRGFPGTIADQLNKANYWAGPDRLSREEGAAEANVAQKSDAARAQAEHVLAARGLTPGSGQWTAAMANQGSQRAAGSAAAQNQARLNTQAQGRALRAQGMQNLQRLPQQAASEINLGVSGLSSAENAAFANTSLGAQTMGTPKDYLNAGISDVKFQPLGQQSQSSSAQSQQTVSAARGGKLPASPTTGGAIPTDASPSHGAQVDDIPARLNAGEFVIPRDVAAYLGKKHLTNLIVKSRKAMGAPQQPIGPTFSQDGTAVSQHADTGGSLPPNPQPVTSGPPPVSPLPPMPTLTPPPLPPFPSLPPVSTGGGGGTGGSSGGGSAGEDDTFGRPAVGNSGSRGSRMPRVSSKAPSGSSKKGGGDSGGGGGGGGGGGDGSGLPGVPSAGPGDGGDGSTIFGQPAVPGGVEPDWPGGGLTSGPGPKFIPGDGGGSGGVPAPGSVPLPAPRPPEAGTGEEEQPASGGMGNTWGSTGDKSYADASKECADLAPPAGGVAEYVGCYANLAAQMNTYKNTVMGGGSGAGAVPQSPPVMAQGGAIPAYAEGGATLPYGAPGVSLFNNDTGDVSDLGAFNPDWQGDTVAPADVSATDVGGASSAGGFTSADQSPDNNLDSGMPQPPVFQPIQVNPAPYYNGQTEPLPTSGDNTGGAGAGLPGLPPNPEPMPLPGTGTGLTGGLPTLGTGTVAPTSSPGVIGAGPVGQVVYPDPAVPHPIWYAGGGPVRGAQRPRPVVPLPVTPKDGIFHGALKARAKQAWLAKQRRGIPAR